MSDQFYEEASKRADEALRDHAERKKRNENQAAAGSVFSLIGLVGLVIGASFAWGVSYGMMIAGGAIFFFGAAITVGALADDP